METSLHRELKSLYADEHSRLEVPLGKYRIDVVRGEQLIEIQHGPLTAIRDKVRDLLKDYEVLVVKPIVVRKQLIKLGRKGGREKSRRMSPKRGTLLDLFNDLVHFTRVFPHKRLTLEVPLVEVEELRYPGHGRRRWRRSGDFQIEDQRLTAVHETHRFRTAKDLARLLPKGLPGPFHTGHLAEALGIDRRMAQQIAYTLRHVDTIQQVGKQGNALMYRPVVRRRARKAA